LSGLSHSSSTSGSAVVVGSGIVGVSVAEALARRGCHVRVVDRLPEARGEATPNSWAWINANSKKPKEYQDLNILVCSVS
jgi:glycine/D-amino acid oxidase-like deaminating enzyme